MKLTLKIWRQKNAKAKGTFMTYKVEKISPEMSFLEMLDALNNKLVAEDKDPVAFDHDCREGICGSCGMYINGHPHGPVTAVTTCHLSSEYFFFTGMEFASGAAPALTEIKPPAD